MVDDLQRWVAGEMTEYNHYIDDISDRVGPKYGETCGPFRLIAVALSPLGENLESCARAILAPEELRHYKQFTFMKRRREWLGGRLACKEAVARLVGGASCLADIVVTNTEQGRPQVTGDWGRVQVSISHSGDVAMGLAAYVPCGLDVQEVTESLGRVQEKFMHGAENGVMAEFHGQEREQLGLVWAIKESLRKQLDLYPLLGFLEARLERIAGDGDGFIVRCCPQPNNRPLPLDLPLVYVRMYAEKALALCLAASN